MMMKPIVRATVALGLGAALMASVSDTSFARNRWVGPAIGFGAGVVVGTAAANAGYNNPYYYGYNNPYGRSYAAAPYYEGYSDPYGRAYYGGYNDPYGGAYAAAPGYAYPSRGSYYNSYYNSYRSNRDCTAENLGRTGC